MINWNNLNLWIAVAALGLGVIAMVAVAVGLPAVLGQGEVMIGVGQVLLLLMSFVTVFLAAVLTGRIARENGVTYGLICSAGAVIVIVFAMPLGILTVLLALTTIAGGLNGGMMVERANRRRRR